MGCNASTSVATVNGSTPPTVTASLNSNSNHNHKFSTPIKVTTPLASPAHSSPEPEADEPPESRPSHIFYGGQGILPDRSLGEHILQALRKYAEAGRLAQIDVDSGEEWSFADLLAHSVRTAKALEEMGLGPGDIVAFFSRNYHELFAAVLGTLMSGCTCAAMVPSNTVPELQHQLRLVKPRILMTEPALIPIAKVALDNFPLPVILVSLLSSPDVPEGVPTLDEFSGSGAESETDLASYNAVLVPNLKDHVGFILYSSGTTGLPKGVMVLDYGLLQFCLNMKHFAKNAEQTFLDTSPMSWISGVWILLATVHMGITRVFIPVINEVKLVRAILTKKVRRWVSAPPVLMAMSANPNVPQGLLSSVVVLIGGSALTAEMYETARKRLGGVMLSAYGATEAGLVFEQSEDNPRPGTMGELVSNVTVKVVDIDNEEDVTEPNVTGELRVKGPSLMKGYVGNPKATAEAFDDNGFLKTGDLVYFDEEGTFYFVDRMKEMIKYRSYQVAPTEVESVLLGHPAVKDVCVIGRPYDVDGELPTAFIVLAPGAHATVAELNQLVTEQLSDPKKLRGGIFFLDAIPRTSTGKTMRKELKAMLDQYPIPKENEL